MKHEVLKSVYSSVNHSIRLVRLLGTHDSCDDQEEIVLSMLYNLDDYLRYCLIYELSEE